MGVTETLLKESNPRSSHHGKGIVGSDEAENLDAKQALSRQALSLLLTADEFLKYSTEGNAFESFTAFKKVQKRFG